jgi:FKBP-type peptidyl-prolyl cis-trans isomerase
MNLLRSARAAFLVVIGLSACGGPLPQRSVSGTSPGAEPGSGLSAGEALRPTSSRTAPPPKGTLSPIPVTEGDPQWGDRYAPVTLVAFYDPQEDAIVRTLARLAGTQDRSKLRIVHKFREQPGSPTLLAQAAAGVHVRGGSAASLDFLMRAVEAKRRAGLTEGNVTPTSDVDLLDWATKAGLANPAKWLAELKQGQFRGALADAAKLAAQLGAPAPMAIYANGQLAVGVTAEDLVALVEREARKAALRTERGTQREDLYAESTIANLERANAGVSSAMAARDDASLRGPSNDLQITDITPGDGATVKRGDTVVVHYTGMLLDGTVFDSSKPRGQTFSFEIGRGMVIKGWDRGLIGMRVGGKRRLVIPPALGYGERGAPPKIPPNAVLTFDVELIETK